MNPVRVRILGGLRSLVEMKDDLFPRPRSAIGGQVAGLLEGVHGAPERLARAPVLLPPVAQVVVASDASVVILGVFGGGSDWRRYA